MSPPSATSAPAAVPLASADDAVELSVVVPVYKNAATLPQLWERLHAVLDALRLAYELVFIDDCCPGGSGEVLRRLAARDPRLRVVSLAHNVGQNRAVLCGLAHARGRWSVVLDADLQDPPEAIERLWSARSGAVAAVFAGRRGHYQSHRRHLTSRLYKQLLHVLSGAPADAGSFVLLHHTLAERLVALRPPHRALVAMIGCMGAASCSVPVQRDRRRHGASAYSAVGRLRLGLAALACVIECRLGLRGGTEPTVRDVIP